MTRSSTPCRDCGEANYWTGFSGEMKPVIDAEGICFTCAFWRVAVTKKHDTVIAGRIYSPGDVNKKPGGQFNGMAGRRFEIEYFDGRRIVTHDLWSGSEIPAKYREQIPDTARFLGGAGFVKIGDGGAWNPSRAES